MSVSKSAILTVLAGAALTAVPGAWATPAPLTPGGSVSPVPTYSSSGTPTVTVLGETGEQAVTEGDVTVNFEEFALDTSLNPRAVTFAFLITTSNNPGSLSATLPGYAGFKTSVESCDPFTATTVCGTSTGSAARSGGTGDVLTFSMLGTTPVSAGPLTLYASNAYGIFTDAPHFTDPAVTVNDDGSSFVFKGLGPATSTAVPEPATLALFALGLSGAALARRRRSAAV